MLVPSQLSSAMSEYGPGRVVLRVLGIAVITAWIPMKSLATAGAPKTVRGRGREEGSMLEEIFSVQSRLRRRCC